MSRVGPNDPASAYPSAPAGGGSGSAPVALHYTVTGQTLTSAPADGSWLPDLAAANSEPTGPVSQADWDANGYGQAQIPVSALVPTGLYSGYINVSGNTYPDQQTTTITLDSLVFDENQTITLGNNGVFRLQLAGAYGFASGLFLVTADTGALSIVVEVAAGPVDWTPSIDIVIAKIADLPAA